MSRKARYGSLRSVTDPLSKEKYTLHAITTQDENESKKKISLIKRFSPFLILSCLLVVLFPYMMITGTGNVKNFWILLFLFPFTISNLLFADFAIWKYFSGKKIIPIWVIELSLSILIVHLLV